MKMSDKNKILALLTELYPVEDSESPFLLSFQAVELAQEYHKRKLKEIKESENELCAKLVKEQNDHVKTHDHYGKQIKELEDLLKIYYETEYFEYTEEFINRVKQALK